MTAEARNSALGILRTAVAWALAATFAGLVAYVVPLEVRHHGNVMENGLVERTQLALLFLGAAAFAARAIARRETPRALALCSLALLAMAVRELDGWFDAVLGHGSWAGVDAVVALAMAAIVATGFSATLKQLDRFCKSRRFPVFAAGIVSAVVVAQILGWKGIWNGLFDIPLWHEAVSDPSMYFPDGKLLPQYDIPRHVKNTVEEGVELGSYLLLLFSAFLPGASRKE